MNKHTPGPWNVACESGEWFATLQDYSPIPCTIENARLIAAAPDLLEALKRLAGMAETFSGELHKDHPDVVDARAAIAKATNA